MGKKVLVVSGVNLIDAGPLSVFRDFLDALVKNQFYKKYRIIALVGKKELFFDFKDYIELIEYRKSKESWVNRIYLEYIGFKQLSIQWNVDTWISMHDTTPNVVAKHRYVYCHNPSPFNKMSVKEARFGVKYYIFSKVYKYIYKINIKKNDAVIVQQEWMRSEFIRLYGIKNVIVARPSIPEIQIKACTCNLDNEIFFIFPSFPRYYKNFENACEAVKRLNKENFLNFKLYITLNGDENSYSRYLKRKYGNIDNIIFCGLLKREKLIDLYSKSSCLLFLSKLETWGLPISEYKFTNRPMIVADLPYAHETVGNYCQAGFVDPDDPIIISKYMKKVIDGYKLEKSEAKPVSQPYAENWGALLDMILGAKE